VSEQQFLDWMKKQEYTDVKVIHYKTRDHVWYKTPDGNKAQVIMTKGHHIEDLSENDYHDIAISKADREVFWFATFMDTACGFASGLPFKPSTWSIKCTRCGHRIDNYHWAFPCTLRDDFGDDRDMILCWDCDWDLMNGGEPFADRYDIHQERRENLAAYDPVNYGHLAGGQ